MGIDCKLTELFSFKYKEPLDNELTEHEFDHVFIGISDESPRMNQNEVVDCKVISYLDLHLDVISNPDSYTVWFKIIYERIGMYVLDRHLNSREIIS